MELTVRKNLLVVVLVVYALIGGSLAVKKVRFQDTAKLTSQDFDDMLNSSFLNEDFTKELEGEGDNDNKSFGGIDDSFIDQALDEMDCLVASSELMVLMGQKGRREYAFKLTEAISKGEDPDKVKKPKNMNEMIKELEIIEGLVQKIEKGNCFGAKGSFDLSVDNFTAQAKKHDTFDNAEDRKVYEQLIRHGKNAGRPLPIPPNKAPVQLPHEGKKPEGNREWKKSKPLSPKGPTAKRGPLSTRDHQPSNLEVPKSPETVKKDETTPKKNEKKRTSFLKFFKRFSPKKIYDGLKSKCTGKIKFLNISSLFNKEKEDSKIPKNHNTTADKKLMEELRGELSKKKKSDNCSLASKDFIGAQSLTQVLAN